jgi:hypothetical protein
VIGNLRSHIPLNRSPDVPMGLGSAGLFPLVFFDCQRVQVPLHEPCVRVIVTEELLKDFQSTFIVGARSREVS